jgi:ribosomal protein RSM22 (predicted rRNA methylase)
VAAYAAARVPATYGATHVALDELRRREPRLAPDSQLDVGAGPGTALWAARELWPSLRRRVALEIEPRMLELGRRVAAELGVDVDWLRGSVPGDIPSGPFDLVTLAYVLGELDYDVRADTVERAWAAADHAVVVVEPGTPAGYAHVLAARDALIARGAHVAAPCPHDRECPLVGGHDWCHFAVRVARSRAHRVAKDARLGYEDEKFSYAVMVRSRAEQARARILRHPQVRSGHVALELCAPEGLRREVVSRSHRQRYRAARAASWGDDLAIGG